MDSTHSVHVRDSSASPQNTLADLQAYEELLAILTKYGYHVDDHAHGLRSFRVAGQWGRA